MVTEEKIKEKKQISFGKLIDQARYKKTTSIPDKVKEKIAQTPYYLFIYIPSDEILKISVFPIKSARIKKILIRLKEFSPELVKGISEIMKKFNLGNSTIHTTGLCFEKINCYYETYVSIDDLPISLEKLRKEFLKVPRVEGVKIIDIQVTPT
ncbi:MAG: hypothetical protein DRO88_05945 [Promethearchaeia archaeon]|nr:MAG: hypothetical protein DRO88_05945 [Candidatus Lokiarchaeia archaeon]